MTRFTSRFALSALLVATGATLALAQPTKENKPAQPTTAPAAKPADAPKGAQPETKPAPKPDAGNSADAMKAWEEAGKPGENQAKLKAFVGEWDAAIKDYSAGPSAKPVESKGSCKTSMTLGGRYLHTKVDATMMGKEFDGQGTVGYNAQTKQYEYTWIDSMSTCIYWSTGTCDADGKTFTFTGKMYDPSAKKDVKTREVWHITAPEKYTIESFMVGPDGKDAKLMEIALTKTGDDKSEHGKGKHDDDKDKGKKDEPSKKKN